MVAAVPGSTVGGASPFGETLGMTPCEGEQNEITGRKEDDEVNLPMEPFVGGVGMHHAQWPNRLAAADMGVDSTDWQWTNVASEAEKGSKADGLGKAYDATLFKYMASAPFGSWTDWEDVVGHGFWSVDWFDGYLPVKLGSTPGTLSVGMTKSKEMAEQMDVLNEGARYAVLNSFNALDMPGEYVFKRAGKTAFSTGYIYFIPPAGAATNAELIVSTNKQPLIRVAGIVDGVTIDGVNVDSGRGVGIGIEATTNVRIFNSKVVNMGTMGIEANGDFIHIKSTEIAHVGGRAVYLDGGDRVSLTKSGNLVEKSTIHHSPRRILHYAECLTLSGVGVVARENTIYAAPAAICELTGNDHVLEYNTIHHVALDTFDTGAIHWAAFSPSSWGHKINHNLIYKVGFKNNPCSSSTSCMLSGIYADDGSFGFEATGNVIWLPEPAARDRPAGANPEWFSDEIQTIGVFVNAGSRNSVTNNVVIDAQFAYSSSGGFMVAGGFGVTPPIKKSSDFWKDMRAKDYQDGVYAAAYPVLANLLDKYPKDCKTNPRCAGAPFGETVASNVGVQITGLTSSQWAAKVGALYPNIFQLPSAFTDDEGGMLTFSDSNFAGLATNVAGTAAEALEAGDSYDASVVPDLRLKSTFVKPVGWAALTIDANGVADVPTYSAPKSIGAIAGCSGETGGEGDDDDGDRCSAVAMTTVPVWFTLVTFAVATFLG